MKFQKFEVENYRSLLEKCEIRISQLTTIIGPNNEGKSNILRAIVSAVKVLESIAEEVASLRKEDDALSVRLWRTERVYDWSRDYPLSRQKDKRKGNGRSVFTLNFLLDEEELDEIRALTKSLFKKPIVSVRLELGPDDVLFRMNLKGIFNKKASRQKMVSVAQFITSKISVCYIDAVRTSETAAESISHLVGMQIRKKLYGSEKYKKFEEEICRQKEAILNEISTEVSSSLKMFLPSLKSASIKVDEHERRSFGGYRNFAPSVSIDDGELTPLSQKGSGVQSLIAIAMARFVSQRNVGSLSCFVLAIEEPESHLHPDAVHRVRATLESIALQTPVIVTTHSPLLVNTNEINANVVVSKHKATPAKSKDEIRKLLGVHASDSLLMAEKNILVEGASDERILKAIFVRSSQKLAQCINCRNVAIINARGCSKIRSIVQILKSSLCRVHVVLDDDTAGRDSGKALFDDSVITYAEVTYLKCPGMNQSEIEDMIVPEIYWPELAKKFGLGAEIPRKINAVDRKWSERIRYIFERAGKPWDEDVEIECKAIVATAVEEHPSIEECVRECRRDVVKSIISRMEEVACV